MMQGTILLFLITVLCVPIFGAPTIQMLKSSQWITPNVVYQGLHAKASTAFLMMPRAVIDSIIENIQQKAKNEAEALTFTPTWALKKYFGIGMTRKIPFLIERFNLALEQSTGKYLHRGVLVNGDLYKDRSLYVVPGTFAVHQVDFIESDEVGDQLFVVDDFYQRFSPQFTALTESEQRLFSEQLDEQFAAASTAEYYIFMIKFKLAPSMTRVAFDNVNLVLYPKFEKSSSVYQKYIVAQRNSVKSRAMEVRLGSSMKHKTQGVFDAIVSDANAVGQFCRLFWTQAEEGQRLVKRCGDELKRWENVPVDKNYAGARDNAGSSEGFTTQGLVDEDDVGNHTEELDVDYASDFENPMRPPTVVGAEFAHYDN
ncbi:hypothetical protein MIR68_000564 [Amoeboaphelidium protococcarum]|nr:hypothetical protein MIR68_000564 [Amoeboaphelidium protococcarum]